MPAGDEPAAGPRPDAAAPPPAASVLPDEATVPVSGGLRKEREVVPGVYFTPGSTGGTDGRVTPAPASQPDPEPGLRYTDIALLGRDALIHHERELARSVAKLVESNDEMLAFDPDEKDDDLVQARKENDVTIVRMEDRLKLMRDRLEFLDPSDHRKH